MERATVLRGLGADSDGLVADHAGRPWAMVGEDVRPPDGPRAAVGFRCPPRGYRPSRSFTAPAVSR
jgi:hypothetical protein